MVRGRLALVLVLLACDPDAGKLTAAECASPEVALFGVNIDPANPLAAPTPKEVHQLGARWVRFAYKAEKGMAFYEKRIREYRSAGIKVLLNVSYEALRLGKPAHDASASEWEAYSQAFVWAAGEVATRIGSGVDAYEVWNEPDQLPEETRDPACTCDVSSRCEADCGCDYQCYDPFVPPEVLGPMASAAGQVLGATRVPVLLGGFSSGQPSYVESAIDAGAGLRQFSGIAVHPYGADWIEGVSLRNSYDNFAIGGRKVWVTEIGIAAPEGEVASYLQHIYDATIDIGYAGAVVPVIFWFAWSDANRPGFGLIDDKGKPKASYEAYQDAAPASHGKCEGVTGPAALADGCGDGVCSASETVESCGADCGCAAPSACGTVAPFGCYCDAPCQERGDCCSDVAAACGA
ncbi:MAG TPA: hypothetical protein VFU21_13040 [Kofleriaceae bacterium]|nr:hypothetical protein [Kofleriaceae bacterium]